MRAERRLAFDDKLVGAVPGVLAASATRGVSREDELAPFSEGGKRGEIDNG